jgi:hypothetical protein
MISSDMLARRRQWLLLCAALGFLIWQLPPLAGRLVPPRALLPLGLAGFLLFFGSLAAVWLWTWQVRKAGAWAAVEDELTRHNRLVAFNTGFWAMLILSAGLLVAAQSVAIRAADAAHLILVAGVVAPMFRFASLERFGERG